MTLKERIQAFAQLGERIKSLTDDEIDNLSFRARNENSWFTSESVKSTLNTWGECLTEKSLSSWTKDYALTPKASKKVGLVMAGNIPMVGFHDLLSVLISGHTAMVKLSSQDKVLIQFVISEIRIISEILGSHIVHAERMNEADAIIATGSDNSARYFKHYFAQHPHIIRQNRTAIAVIKGNETAEELTDFGKDYFQYFGLGCRNVSKIYAPKGYDFVKLIDALMGYETVLDHHKYRNNYDYNKSIYLVNGEPHLDSGFFLMRESQELVSPISVLFYEYYNSEAELDLTLAKHHDKIQCVVSANGWYEGSIPLGKAQQPELWDYADGVDTLEFLSGI
ncbi:acyl-CoA reductase [uncultured Roseivirga sp.]|uniref:acyl-CoA reductase n=1 Tax=uncultured Roseivirga sp. TaxID=543088 RepID=UPI0030D8F509|tara:strand:+ start:1863 stop:2873 length:1011 start_codon:yes stop_codon:yes gene_type:complete